MIYVVSDIHGCYKEFLELLQLIQFSDEDEMYILGDIVDRGPEPIRLLLDLMMRPNVYPLLGNHEYMALTVLRKLNKEITEENVDSYLKTEDLMDYLYWMQDGGDVTVRQFTKLDMESRTDILEYLEEFSLYEDINISGKRYILVHAGINNFSEEKDMEDYNFADLIFERADYNKRYFKDENTYLVTGHTPTKDGLIITGNGHIVVDCGCVFGGKLAAYCFEEEKSYYVDSRMEE